MDDKIALATEIRSFLERHAKIGAAFDPAYDDPLERFNGPDPLMFEIAAQELEQGLIPAPVRSTWGSGCYIPFGDAEARAWHDDLKYRVQTISNIPTP